MRECEISDNCDECYLVQCTASYIYLGLRRDHMLTDGGILIVNLIVFHKLGGNQNKIQII